MITCYFYGNKRRDGAGEYVQFRGIPPGWRRKRVDFVLYALAYMDGAELVHHGLHASCHGEDNRSLIPELYSNFTLERVPLPH